MCLHVVLKDESTERTGGLICGEKAEVQGAMGVRWGVAHLEGHIQHTF